MIKSKSKPTRSIKSGIAPTKERRRQNGGIYSEVIDRDANGKVFMQRFRAVYECPLDVYRGHKFISDREYRAGMKFNEAYYGAIICRRYDFRPVSRNQAEMESTMSDRIINEAYAALPIKQMQAVIDVCGHDLPVTNIKYLEKLRKGLGTLALKWNMAAIEICERKSK